MTYRETISLEAITKGGISGTATGSTLIGTTEPGMRFVVLFVNIEPTVISGTLTTVPTVSIGTNSTSYNNLLAASPLTSVNAVNKAIQFSSTTLATSVASSTGIYINVTVAATGVTLTYTMRVTVLGFYF